MEEMTRQPDFICDPVPGNFRQRFEGRKGKNRSLTVLVVVLFLFAVSVLDAILFAAGPDGDQYAALGGSRVYAFLTVLLKGILSTAVFTILPLAGAVKWHSSMTEKLYAAKIRKYESGWFAGFFTADCLVTEDKKGYRGTWYYNDIVSVEEDSGSFRVRGEGGELLIPKMYLKRDAVRSVRNHLRRYCADVYRQDFAEEGEEISLVLTGQEASEDAARRLGEIHSDYLDYVKNSTSFYYTETRLWVIGACVAYLIRCALSGSGDLSRLAGIGILVIILCIPVLTGLKNMAARRTVRARARRMKAGISTELKIGKGGVLLRSGQETRQSWNQIRRILEGQEYFVIGRIYLSKKSLTEEEAGQVRALCQKYAGRKYTYVEMEPQKAGEIFRTFLPLLCFAFFTAAVTAAENGVAFYQEDGRNTGTQSDGTWGADRGSAGESGTDGADADGKNGSGEQGSREPVYVTTPDKAALHLNASEIRIDECYSHNEVNYSSRFFIDGNGILYGASANEHGELGNGTTEADITAKGFYREIEVARDVCHVSLGKEFMVYLTDSGELMGTGNLPAAGASYVAVELMNDVQYAKCSPYGLIVLKEDGTVWCAGRLCDKDGNVIREYEGFEQVMDHAVYADAGERTMAVIRSDGSLWMWGDNSSQQCGVDSRVAEVFAEPTQVRENVRMVWLDRLAFYDEQEYQGYLSAVSAPTDMDTYHTFWTYVLQDDGQVYACGRDGTFVKVTVIEE